MNMFGGADKKPKEESDGGKFIAIPKDQNLRTTEEEAEILERIRLEKENGQEGLTDQG